MKVVLLQDVRGQGKKGQLLNVSDGYARNYLLPRKLAAEATRDILNAMEQHDEAVRRRAEEDLARARLLAKDLEGITVIRHWKKSSRGCSSPPQPLPPAPRQRLTADGGS